MQRLGKTEPGRNLDSEMVLDIFGDRSYSMSVINR